MRKTLAVLAAAAVGALALAALSAAGTRSSTMTGASAKLTAAQEVPKPAGAKGTGQFTGTFKGNKLTWKLTFSGLTGAATAAHIHLGAAGKAGNVAIPLCGPCKSGMTGHATFTAALMTKLTKHGLYVNVHTAKNAAGEIRGQLVGK